MPLVFIHGCQKRVFGHDLRQIVRVKVKEAYPGSLFLLKGLSLRTKKRCFDTLKMSQPTDEEYLVVFGGKSLQMVGHSGFTPRICQAFLKPGLDLP